MPPSNIDMSAIREAIARRRGGGAMPVGQQMTAPAAPTPQGGFPTPSPQPPAPQQVTNQMPTASTAQRQAQGGGTGGPGGGQAPLPPSAKEVARALANLLIQPGAAETNKPLLQNLIKVL